MLEVMYPTTEIHKKNWDELAKNITSIKEEVRNLAINPLSNSNKKKGSLTILGSGIETIGISVGDQKLIEEADKVLYCVADPVTVVWLNQLRPDALDLYVLYGENKIRYITYMQMTEAQLYWVRQGLKVVCVFYGHPGIFVLSTHRAIMIAKREGHRAVMKAGVSALDTLCADLGVDPCNPGLQTYEATEALIRKRVIDTTANVVLWQVGLIGESGYRRLGFLNKNFSYFINWLQGIYGEDYQITHYIGARYPTLPPVIEVYKLSELHHPAIQSKINGISTFYIPPKDTIETDRETCLALGMIKSHQEILPTKTPLREIGNYSTREMKAFEEFANFKIPSSYKFQTETEASKFIIALKFSPDLQEIYQDNPVLAINKADFNKLSDLEKSLLVSKDSGAIQVAAKGMQNKDFTTSKFISDILTNKICAVTVLDMIKNCTTEEAKIKLLEFKIDYEELTRNMDYLYSIHLFPWTGIYSASNHNLLVTIIGNVSSPRKSLIYINDKQVKSFTYKYGALSLNSDKHNPFNGFFRFDATGNKRQLIGKVWLDNQPISKYNNLIFDELPLDRTSTSALLKQNEIHSLKQLEGSYILKTTGKYSKILNNLTITENTILIDDIKILAHRFNKDILTWNLPHVNGEIKFLKEPFFGGVECFGTIKSKEPEKIMKCYGSNITDINKQSMLNISLWIKDYLYSIINENRSKGGLMLWYKSERQNLLHQILGKIINIIT